MCKKCLSKKELIYKIIRIIIFILPVCLGIFGILYTGFLISHKIFDKIELEEFNITYHSSPLLNIIVSDTESGGYSLFGSYKGLQGGHKYDECDYLFEGTCESDKNKNVYCPGKSSEDGDTPALDQKTCVDFYQINSFPYTKLKDRYYYAEKKASSYKDLLNNTVNKDEQCPKTKKKCGYLNKESKLCLSFEEKCPINDIIINHNSTYSEDNITYKTIILGDDYIHYTNEKIDNQIIFDLLISIENPLSKIETKESNYDNIFQLNEEEADIYYNGNIDDIIAYKNIYNTGITLKELFEYYDIFDTINKEPRYKIEYFNSNIYIFKKYPIPLNGITEEEINNVYKLYDQAILCNFCSGGLLVITLFCTVPFIVKSPNIIRIIAYLILSLIHIGICLLFFINNDILLHRGILKYYEYKDYHRIQLLIVFLFYIIISIIQNFWTLYKCIIACRELATENKKKNEKRNEIFLEDEKNINCNNSYN